MENLNSNLCKESDRIKATKIKVKTNDIFLIQFDINDENCDFSNVLHFVEQYRKELPKESAIVVLPNYITLEAIDKEMFREFLDKAEEFYKTL